ncbi:MAG: MazG nucleotide pyrophosphohydrolase domain-containing protein [Candidatus Helarchaeota archaeon]
MEIREFQKLMKDLYYNKDKNRGIGKTFMWFVEEVGELANSLKESGDQQNTESIGAEMADVFAWLCSLANILNIDLEDVTLKKYPKACSKCKQNPCVCKEK